MMFNIAFGMAMWVPILVVVDLLYMLYRNAKLHIDDDDQAWNDGEMRVFTYFHDKMPFPWCVYVALSVVMCAGTAASLGDIQEAIAAGNLTKAAKMKTVGDVFCCIYVSVTLFIAVFTVVINHLRTIRRLEKKGATL